MKETVFYIIGVALAVSAVAVSFIGLKAGKFPGKLMPLVVVWFAVFAVGAGTFAVLYAAEHEEHREHELEHAGKEIEKEQTSEPFEEEEAQVEAEENGGGSEESEGGGEAPGPGGTLEVIANESALLYEEESLEAESGKVTIDFNNPSAIAHDVAIEKDGEKLGGTELVTEGEASTTVELEAGDYVFYCTVPGHREAGMEGPLTVR